MKRSLSLFLFSFLLCSEEIQVDLVNPTFKNGILYTTQGGVIRASDIRIQASDIQYYHRMEEGELVQKIEAEGDLMIQYKDRLFIGSELEFDLNKKTGTLYNGKTSSSMWFVGGEAIHLKPDGSYQVADAFITASENKQSDWDLHAKTVRVIKDQSFEADTVRLRLLGRSVFWLPSFKLNLKKNSDPLFTTYLNWNKGPKVGFRYEMYSWHDLALFGRLEYRWKKGWGGSIESEYIPKQGHTSFVTRNYVGTDRLFNAVDSEFRYRVQGDLRSKTENKKTQTVLTWDKYSDVRMPGDFESEDFEVNTALKTVFQLNHKESRFLASLKVRPRVNSFESIKQDLPTLLLSAKPFEIKNTGIISSQFLKASYLNFQYSDQLVTSLQDFQSPRIELFEKLYRPIYLGPLTVTPELAGRAILYGKSPVHTPQYLGLLSYGARANLRGIGQIGRYRHVLEPYIQYQALTRPTVSPNSHYIFSIQDGYQKLQQIEMGIHNLFFSNRRIGKEASFTADLYANAFFSDPTIPKLIPRLYLDLHWQLPSLFLSWKNCYSFWHQLVDFSNARIKWTLNQNAALCIEARYRSKYDWRKADHTNFILDVTRSEAELLESPLSDRRVTLLSRAFFRINPFWELKLETHHGFYRLFKNQIKEKPYNEFQIHLYTWINSAWKLHLYYGYTLHNHFDWTINFRLVQNGF